MTSMRAHLFACALVVGCALFFVGCPAVAQNPVPPPPLIEDLGDGRYQVGAITVDKRARSFSMPARVINLGMPDMPLEFLAVAKDGAKAYESILELSANAIEFNLACILIGLDSKHAVAPNGNFDPAPADGDPVDLWIEWDLRSKHHRERVSTLLKLSDGSRITDEWVYVGSYFFPDGRYAAQEIGILVGFVHDRESVIQHRSGLGMGGYGSVTFNQSTAFLPGMPVTFVVSRPEGG